MLSKILNSNSISSLIILIMLALALWIGTLSEGTQMAGTFISSPLYNFVFLHISDLKIIYSIIALALLIFEALLINNVLAENELIPRNSYIGAYIFIIISGLFQESLILNPVIFANFFIIAALWLFFRLYEETEAYAVTFNIGMLLSIGSMFFFPSVVFIILILAGFIIYRLFSWREWLISIIGLALPYVFFGVYYFWNDCLTEKILLYKKTLGFIDLHKFSPSLYIYIVIAFIGLLLFLSVAKLLLIVNQKAIRIRKFISFIIWFFIMSLLSMFLSINFIPYGFFIILTSASVLLTIYLSYSKKSTWVELVLFSLIALLVSSRLGLWNL